MIAPALLLSIDSAVVHSSPICLVDRPIRDNDPTSVDALPSPPIISDLRSAGRCWLDSSDTNRRRLKTVGEKKIRRCF